MEIYNLILSIKLTPKMYIKDEKNEYIYYILSRHCAEKNKMKMILEKFHEMVWSMATYFDKEKY